MKKLMTYTFEGGPLDQYLDQLIGNSREAREERQRRGRTPLVVGKRATVSHFVKTEQGFFYKDQGVLFRTYLYLKRSRVKSFGLPKRHFFECEKVKENLPYVFATQDLVTINCSETKHSYYEVALGICGYCRSIFQEKTSQFLLGMSLEEFILTWEESDQTKTTATNHDGYILNWTEVSTAYRKTMNFTCEKCDLSITKSEHQHFIHTHHVDRNKRNNHRSNLQCLCIRCHSQVDSLHRKNFAEPHQKRLLKQFRALYSRP